MPADPRTERLSDASLDALAKQITPAPAAPLKKALAAAGEALADHATCPGGGKWRECSSALASALSGLLAALDADRGEAEAALQAVLDYEPKEVCKDEFAYDRMVEAYRDVARRYFARREEKEEPE